MTTTDSFDRRLAAWLLDDADGRLPDHLAEVLVATRATRQRPGWSSLERWLPMGSIALRLRTTPTPRFTWLLVVLAVTLALIGAAVFFGTRPPRLEPYGPAGNGVVLVEAGNDIYLFDPATGTSRPLISGPTVDKAPFFSRDGSMFVFARDATLPGHSELVLAQADGTIVRTLTEPLAENSIDWSSSLDWSPDGSRLAVIDGSPNTFLIVNTDGTAPQAIDLGMKAEYVRWLPNGRELVYRGVLNAPGSAPSVGLYVVGADGHGFRPIVQPIGGGGGSTFQMPALSPDGTRIVYALWGEDRFPGGDLYVVDVAGGTPERLVFQDGKWSDYYAEWSPDGRQIVFSRGLPQESYHLAIASIDGGPVVNIGPDLAWDGGAIAVFSPDGSKVIARFNHGATWIFDATGGPGQELRFTSGDPLSWQRVALP